MSTRDQRVKRLIERCIVTFLIDFMLGCPNFRSRFYQVPVAFLAVGDVTYGGRPNFRCPSYRESNLQLSQTLLNIHPILFALFMIFDMQ